MCEISKSARLSLDNGTNFVDMYDIATDKELQEKILEYSEQIFSVMDGDIYALVHKKAEFEIGDDIQFIINYLNETDVDLIIG